MDQHERGELFSVLEQLHEKENHRSDAEKLQRAINQMNANLKQFI